MQPLPARAINRCRDGRAALLYLTKTELMKIEGGFIVVYNTMQIGRLTDRRTRYGKEQYRLLDEFYKQRIRQTLRQHPLNDRARFVDMTLNETGLEVSRS